MDPIGLKLKPELPWYYMVYLQHYNVLDKCRTYGVGMKSDSSGMPVFYSKPNPIDLATIFSYNKEIVKEDPEDFLYLIQCLEEKFLTKE